MVNTLLIFRLTIEMVQGRSTACASVLHRDQKDDGFPPYTSILTEEREEASNAPCNYS
ncbi:hypothetical protein D3C87_1087220 [compost metagenome]